MLLSLTVALVTSSTGSRGVSLQGSSLFNLSRKKRGLL